MLQYNYDNIIIVTKAVILEFLSARFVYLSTPQPAVLSFLTGESIRITKGNKVLIN